MLISETRIRSLVRKALLEAASQEDLDTKAKELEKEIPGLTPEQAMTLAKAELGGGGAGGAIAAGGTAEGDKPIPQKGFGQWDKAGGDAFRKWMNDNHPKAAKDEFDLDPPGDKTSHTNKFIRNAYEGTFTGDDGEETYGKAWLSSLAEAEANAAKEAEDADKISKGRGPIGSMDEFFQQREAQYNLYRQANEGDEKALKAVVNRTIKSYWREGLPIMYVYHVNEWDRGDGDTEKHERMSPAAARNVEGAVIDVPGRRAIGKTEINYKERPNMLAIAYDPAEEVVYMRAQGQRAGFMGIGKKSEEQLVKFSGVKYANGKLDLQNAQATSEEVGEDPDEIAESFDDAHAEARKYVQVFKNAANDWAEECWDKHNLKNADKTFSNVEEAAIIKATKRLERDWQSYAKGARPYQIKYAKAKAAYEAAANSTFDNDSDETPWGSEYTGAYPPWKYIRAAIKNVWGFSDWSSETKPWVRQALDDSEYKEFNDMLERSNEFIREFV